MIRYERSRGRLVLPRGGHLPVRVARGYWERLRGLMLMRRPPTEPFLFEDARALHTSFMCFPIDMVAFDAKGDVVEVREGVPPWTFVRFPACTRAVAELAAGRWRDMLKMDLEMR